MTSKYTRFINLDPDNICSPAVLKFLNQYVENLNNSYKANPMLFDVGLSPRNIRVKPVKYEVSKKQERNLYLCAGNNKDRPHRPCPLCTIKGFESDHYPLSWNCGVKKLCSKEIIKTIDEAEFVPAAVATIELITTAYPPSRMVLAEFVPRNVPTTVIL